MKVYARFDGNADFVLYWYWKTERSDQMDCKGIIFDMDGTLIDSMGYWHRIGSITLAYLGKTPREPDFDRRVYRADEAEIVRLYEGYGIHFSGRAEFVETYYAAMRSCYEKVQPLPGAVDFLEKMKAAGKKMCVATATRSDLSLPVLERLGLMRYFEFLLCCADVGARKDKPDIYLQSAGRMGLTVGETVVFEDALYCVRTAKNAGFRVVGVLDPTSEQREIDGVKALADRFITGYAELLEGEKCAG